jgi:hypothetical protein
MQDPLRDRVDAQALEHAVADLRVPLQHEPLGFGQLAGLAQDLLGDRELAEVVQARRQPGQLDRLRVDAEARRDAGRKLGDTLGVAAGVDVACVDRLRQARSGPEAGGAVGARRQALELGEFDDIRAPRADAVLPVLLGPVERAVGETDQLVAAHALVRVGGDAGGDGDGTHRVDRQAADPVDDRRRGSQRGTLVMAGEEDRELVAAEPERLAALAQARRDLRQHPVAGRMPEAVVDLLEVVDVDQAERDGMAELLRVDQLALEALVEVAVVAEPRERVREREPHGAQRAEGRALVERDREQRPDESDREGRRAHPEHVQDQRGRAHQRERHHRQVDARLDQLPERAARVERDDRAREQHVHGVEGRRADRDALDDRRRVGAGQQRHEGARGAGGERVGARVVDDADHRSMLGEADEQGGREDDDHAGRRVEQSDARDDEHEHQRHAARLDVVEWNGESLRERRRDEHPGDPDLDRPGMRFARERVDRGRQCGEAPGADGGYQGEEPRRDSRHAAHWNGLTSPRR